MPDRTPKLQRWTDLIAALLKRRYSAPFETLARDVPAYSDPERTHDAVMRMFERDKDELRAFGIEIVTKTFDEGESGYLLDRKGFYLPYLSLAASEGKPGTRPNKLDRDGYRALAELVVEPDELALIARAAARVRALRDPVLSAEADSAMRKLAFDLPIPEAADQAGDFVSAMHSMPTMAAPAAAGMSRSQRPVPARAAEGGFETLNDALRRRKRVEFMYHSMQSNEVAHRSVEPYGLFFLSSHWYLAARDVEKQELRNFRLERMHGLRINSSKPQTSDYEIPSAFNLREHAGSRRAWELGDGAQHDAIIEFHNPTGAARAASRLGVAVEGKGDQRRFHFRRLDSFARWLLSFGGEAVPLQPATLVQEFESQVRATSEIYEDAR